MDIQFETRTKDELLTEYRRLTLLRQRAMDANDCRAVIELAPKIGLAVGELRWRFGMSGSELNAIRMAAKAPALPTWAAGVDVYWSNPKAYQIPQMIHGDELVSGDTLLFSEKANPRILRNPVGHGWEWKVITIVDHFGYIKRFAGTATIEPSRWYVTLRPVKQGQ